MKRLDWLRGLRNQTIIEACIKAEGPKAEIHEGLFKLSDLSIIKDAESGNIYFFIDESVKVKEREYKHTLTMINDPETKIEYLFYVSPSGRFFKRTFIDPKDEKRYSEFFSNRCVEMQIFGEEFGEKEFNIGELIELQNKVNNERQNAKYKYVEQIQYSDSYKGKRLLENLHLATDSSYNGLGRNNGEFMCLENEKLEIKKKNGYLFIVDKENADKEIINPEEYSLNVVLQGWQIASSGRARHDFNGFTLEAFKKIIETKKKEKEKEDSNLEKDD